MSSSQATQQRLFMGQWSLIVANMSFTFRAIRVLKTAAVKMVGKTSRRSLQSLECKIQRG